MKSLYRHLPALCGALLAPLSAQSLDEGYGSTVRALPSGGGQVWVGTAGTAYFNGMQLLLDDGTQTRVLLSLPSAVFGSFTIQASPTELLFGESSNGELWLVPFVGSAAPRRLTSLTFNYSAVIWGGSHAIVSAKTGGFGSPNNDVIAVDLATGQTDTIAVLPGASGPVAIDSTDNLLYGTASAAFPPPPGGTAILRFDRTRVAAAFGPTSLTISDATTLVSGLDAAGSITLDGDDDLFVTDYINNQIQEISDISSGRGTRSVFADYTGAAVSASNVQWVALRLGATGATFEGFQPLGAGALAIHESQFGSTSQVRYVQPARPRTHVPSTVPAGMFDVVTLGGPANGTGLMALGARNAGSLEVALALGFEQTFFWSFAVQPAQLSIPVMFDQDGAARVSLPNPGVSPALALQVQVGFVNGTANAIGSAAPAVFTLR